MLKSLERANIPVILCLNGHDPSSAGGLQADIETCMSLHCQSLTVQTSTFVCDTREVKKIVSTSSELVLEQMRTLLEDIPVKVIKAGFLGSLENVEALHSVLVDYPDIPLIVEPKSFATVNDHQRATIEVLEAIKSLLLPRAYISVATLNQAFLLSDFADSADACAAEILETGCQHVLITGTENYSEVRSGKLYGQRGLIQSYVNQDKSPLSEMRCTSTLGAAVACEFAHGLPLHVGVGNAQKYVWSCLARGRLIGMGNPIPDRTLVPAENPIS